LEKFTLIAVDGAPDEKTSTALGESLYRIAAAVILLRPPPCGYIQQPIADGSRRRLETSGPEWISVAGLRRDRGWAGSRGISVHRHRQTAKAQRSMSHEATSDQRSVRLQPNTSS
jgi:hypothetical protein